MKTKPLGQIAYEAHFKNNPFARSWETVDGAMRESWTEMANAVAREVRRRGRKKK